MSHWKQLALTCSITGADLANLGTVMEEEDYSLSDFELDDVQSVDQISRRCWH